MVGDRQVPLTTKDIRKTKGTDKIPKPLISLEDIPQSQGHATFAYATDLTDLPPVKPWTPRAAKDTQLDQAEAAVKAEPISAHRERTGFAGGDSQPAPPRPPVLGWTMYPNLTRPLPAPPPQPPIPEPSGDVPVEPWEPQQRPVIAMNLFLMLRYQPNLRCQVQLAQLTLLSHQHMMSRNEQSRR